MYLYIYLYGYTESKHTHMQKKMLKTIEVVCIAAISLYYSILSTFVNFQNTKLGRGKELIKWGG